MHNKISTRAVIALGLLVGAPAVGQAQTAAQYNRATQAIQLCASAAGAMIPECAQLRGGLGAAPAPGAANALSGLLGGGGNSGGKAAAAAGLFGMATQALAAQRAPAAPQPAPATAGFPAMHTGDYYNATALATQNAAQAYQACVMRVGPANAAGVQGCIAQLGAASTGGASTGFPGVAQPAPAASALGAAAASAFSAMLGGR
jgi:hypothetical protein